MELRVFTTLCLCLAASAFNIITPRPGEVISVDELYNLTWTTGDVPPNFIVFTIGVEFPNPALVAAESVGEDYYTQGWWSDPFNISGTDGHYLLNLSLWWSPVYNDLPHGSWSISLELFNPEEKYHITTSLNDTIEVKLTSFRPNQNQRPQLLPIKDFSFRGGNGEVGEGSVVWGMWGILSVVLGILIPVLLIGLTICLIRYRWKRHAYGTLAPGDAVKTSGPLSLSETYVPAPRDNEERTHSSETVGPRRFPWSFILAAFLAIAPLLALFATLISLLGLYKVKPSSHSRADFSFNESGSDSTAFYIDYDATRYTTVASWTSSIALLLPGFLTSLIWYRQTQQLESDASLTRYDKLLTPYQLSLLLNLKSGTLSSLWEYVSYILSRRREKQARFLLNTGFVVFLSTLLGYDIFRSYTICADNFQARALDGRYMVAHWDIHRPVHNCFCLHCTRSRVLIRAIWPCSDTKLYI